MDVFNAGGPFMACNNEDVAARRKKYGKVHIIEFDSALRISFDTSCCVSTRASGRRYRKNSV